MRILTLKYRSWPLTFKIPLVVAALMVAVGAIASERVLNRLQEAQERQLADLSDAYLDGLSSSLVGPVVRADPWEVFDILDRASGLYAAVRPLETIVLDDAGRVLASSEPKRFPIGSMPPPHPATMARGAARVEEDAERAYASRALSVEGRDIGLILVAIDAAPILAERREVFWTLVGSNALLTLAAALLGWFAVRRMVLPLQTLNRHLTDALDGEVEPIPDTRIPAAGTEVGRLFRSYNALAGALTERDALMAKAVQEERLAGLGRLASGMAHEINNPLGGLFNALDTLKVHGDRPAVRSATIELLDRGLKGIRDVVRTTLATYRPDREHRPLRQADIDDLQILVRPEVGRKQLAFQIRGALEEPVPLDAFSIRQVLLNLLLNACRAAPDAGSVVMTVAHESGRLHIDIEDSGPGLPPTAELILGGQQPAVRDRGGLGLTITTRMVAELGGTLLASVSGLGGAHIRLSFPIAAPVEAGEVRHVA